MPKQKEEKKIPRGKPRIPTDYLMALADKIHSTSPTKAIIYNTLKDLWVKTYDDGYFRRIADSNNFKLRMNRLKKQSFDSIRDQTEHEIYAKPTQ